MRVRIATLLVLSAGTLCSTFPATAAPALDPWDLLSMKPAEARALLSKQGYRCADIRAYIPANAEGIRHLTFLRCDLPIANATDCEVIEIDITEEKPGKLGVTFRRSECTVK